MKIDNEHLLDDPDLSIADSPPPLPKKPKLRFGRPITQREADNFLWNVNAMELTKNGLKKIEEDFFAKNKAYL